MNFDITAKKRTSMDSDRSGKSQKDDKPRAVLGAKEVKDSPREVKSVPKTPVKETPAKTPVKEKGVPGKEKEAPVVKTPVKKDKKAKDSDEEGDDGPQKLSPEEIAKKLAGYMPVPKRHWGDFCRGDHIRWIDKDGEFSKGGYVRFYFEKEGVRMVQVESILGGFRNDKFYSTYAADLDSNTAVYKKIGVDYHLLRAQFGNEFARLKREIADLKAELEKSKRK